MPEPVRGDQKYLPGLDGLRALAVAAVVVYHLGFGWAQGGLLGVGVFFTLSGYLITDILLGQWASAGRIRLGDFWLRRARRLLPALFVLLAAVAVWVNVFDRARLPGFRGDVVASALYVNNWWYITQHASYYAQFAPPGPLDHLWSLAVEEQFYLVWPWLVLLGVWLLGRRRRPGHMGAAARWQLTGWTLALAAASAVLMAILYRPGLDPTRVYEGTDTRAFGLLTGAALAAVWPTRRPAPLRPLRSWVRWVLDPAGVAGLAIVGLLVWRTNQYSPVMFRGGLVELSLATALAVAAVAVPGSLLGRALGWGPLRWLGVRSYGIYLWHYPVILLAAPAVAGGGLGTLSVPRAVACAVVTVVLAAVSWRVVEEPVRRGFRRRPSASQAASPRGRRRLLSSPLAIAGLCLVMVAGVTTGVVATASRLASSDVLLPVGSAEAGAGAAVRQLPVAAARQPASAAVGPTSAVALHPAAAGVRQSGKAPAGRDPAPRRQAPAARTSCRSVVHIGDSTSEGLNSSNYLPNRAERIPARYARVGVAHTIMEVSGGTSVVETINGGPNAYQVAKRLVAGGYRGCWVLALGVNDTADVFAGSGVGRTQRIKRMMSVIGDQPVLWVEVKSLVPNGPYAERNMRLWNRALDQERSRYPNMRIYDWPAIVRGGWFIRDGIHYTSYGYAQRARLIAAALAQAFPA